MRLVPFIVFAGLATACTACSSSDSEGSQSEVFTSELADGTVMVEQLTPGTISLCKTAATMEVESSANQVRVTSGRTCKSGEEPTIVFDPATCEVSKVPPSHTVVLSCTGMPASIPA